MRMLKILIVVACLLFVVIALHKGAKQRAPKYDVATETKVEGTVLKVSNYWCPIGGDEGTHLVMQTDSRVLEVHVAPRRFLESNGVSFTKGDVIQAVGSMVGYEGHEVMIARKITRGDQTFAFRQPDGRPLWVERLSSYVR